MVGPTAIVVVLAVVVGVGLLGVMPRWNRRREVERLRRRLAGRVMGDEAAVARLVEYERRRNPEGTEEALLRSALMRLERDNR